MKYSPEIEKKLELIDLNKLEIYLEKSGWQKTDTIENKLSIWHRPEFENRDFEILLPTNKALKDFNKALFQAIKILTTFQNLNLNSLFVLLSNFQSDKIQVRVKYEDVDNGTIPLTEGLQLIENAKEIMTAAVMSLMNKKKYYTGNRSEDASKYLDSLKLAQTEVGSFIINILSPLELDGQLLLFEELNNLFPRKVIYSLSESLNTLTSAVDNFNTLDKSNLDEYVANGLNANLCRSIEEMSGLNRKRDVSISINFSNNFLNKSEEKEFQFSSKVIPKISKIGDFLLEDLLLNDYGLQGPVVKLSRGENENDGEITVYSFVEGKYKNVKVNLKKFHYEKAIYAHENKLQIRCIGDILLEKTKTTMTNVKSVEIIDLTTE